MRSKKDIELDHYLVAAARLGDSRATARLAQRWQPRLLRHAARILGDVELARDRTQDAWLEILRGVRSLREARAFPAWAFRIVSRQCARGIGDLSRQRDRASAVEVEQLANSEACQEQYAAAGELHQAIADLPASHRAALSLFYQEGFTVTEVAAVLEIPPGTVKTRLMHARRRLRAVLEGEGQ